ncbi:MAG: SRPBCC family protein [Owenweeksia sp.]
MEAVKATRITVKNTVNAPVKKVWDYWNDPDHITKWNTPHPDWHTPKADNDLRIGGRLVYRMEAKDGSVGFDFSGSYTDVKKHEYIAYSLDDDRKVEIHFEKQGDQTHITETFDAENENPVEMQRAGWQAILDNFKKHTENN